jgi:hypothetical protein
VDRFRFIDNHQMSIYKNCRGQDPIIGHSVLRPDAATCLGHWVKRKKKKTFLLAHNTARWENDKRRCISQGYIIIILFFFFFFLWLFFLSCFRPLLKLWRNSTLPKGYFVLGESAACTSLWETLMPCFRTLIFALCSTEDALWENRKEITFTSA